MAEMPQRSGLTVLADARLVKSLSSESPRHRLCRLYASDSTPMTVRDFAGRYYLPNRGFAPCRSVERPPRAWPLLPASRTLPTPDRSDLYDALTSQVINALEAATPP